MTRLAHIGLSPRMIALAGSFVALLALPSSSRALRAVPIEQQGGYCAPGQTVMPGTCICPSGTTFRMNMPSPNTCGMDGQCACNQGVWNGSGCAVPPPPPPPLPPAMCGGRCAPNQACINDVCVGTGRLQFSLWWDKDGDLDLHLMTPSGAVISPVGRRADGGVLDADDTDGTGPENIFWSQEPPAGTYHICVSAFNVQRDTNFTVQVLLPNGTTQVFRGVRNGTQRGRCAPGQPTYLGSVTTGATAGVPPGQGGVIVQPPGRGQGTVVVQPPGRGQGTVIVQPPSRGQGTVVVEPGRGQGTVVVEPGRGQGRGRGVQETMTQMQSNIGFEVVRSGERRGARGLSLQYLGWDNARYEVRIEGSEFVIAPNGDFGRATRAQTIEFIGWDGQRWSARLDGMAFSIALNGDFNNARTEQGVQFMAWDSARVTVRLVR